MTPASHIEIPEDQTLRIGTLNVNHAPESLAERAQLLCDELNTERPAVFCLQEVTFNGDGSSEQLREIARRTGLGIVANKHQKSLGNGQFSGVAILSSLKVRDSGHFNLRVEQSNNNTAVFAVLETLGGRTLIAITAHLHWGGNGERERLIQLTTIDHHVKLLLEQYGDDNTMVVLTGDFNAQPDGDALRFLTGKGAGSNNRYTFWTDCNEFAAPGSESATVANNNHWAAETAKIKDIVFPALMPNRRIDYIMSYGWSYGKPGSPLKQRRAFDDDSIYGFTASDHYGLITDFWNPALVPAENVSAVSEIAEAVG